MLIAVMEVLDIAHSVAPSLVSDGHRWGVHARN